MSSGRHFFLLFKFSFTDPVSLFKVKVQFYSLVPCGEAFAENCSELLDPQFKFYFNHSEQKLCPRCFPRIP